MKALALKVARIGNSRGVRIPAATLARYGIADSVLMEERGDGILLRPSGDGHRLLSWSETAAEMAAAKEDWSDLDRFVGDGLVGVEWVSEHRDVADTARATQSKSPRKERSSR